MRLPVRLAAALAFAVAVAVAVAGCDRDVRLGVDPAQADGAAGDAAPADAGTGPG